MKNSRFAVISLVIFFVANIGAASNDDGLGPALRSELAGDKETRSEILSKASKRDFFEYQRMELEFIKLDEVQARTIAKSSTSEVIPPLGWWALLRNSSGVCAIRFTNFYRSHTDDANFYSSRESFFAEYDWDYRPNKRSSVEKARYGKGTVYKKPNIWRLIRANNIQCGPLRVNWAYPNKISLLIDGFNSETRNVSNDIQIALTGWKRKSDIDETDPRLVWKYYDPVRDKDYLYGRDGVVVPVEELPGFSSH